MRHILGIWVATATLLLAAGCGTATQDGTGDGAEGADPGTSPSGQPSRQPSSKPTGRPPTDVVAILSASAAGGVPSRAAVDVSNPQGLNRLLGSLRRTGLANQVRATVAKTDVPEGQRLLGSIVNLGCDTPTGVSVTSSGDSIELLPTFTGTPLPECLVPVTSIALVLVPIQG